MSKMKLVIVATLLASAAAPGPTPSTSARRTSRSTSSCRIASSRSRPSRKTTSEFKPELTADQVLSIEGLVAQHPQRAGADPRELIDADARHRGRGEVGLLLPARRALRQAAALFWRLKSAEAAIAVDKAKTPQQKAQAQAQRTRRPDKAKTYLLKAVKTYKGLTDNDAFRNYPKMDMALFYYGYTLQGGKYMKEARAVYDKLLKNYPNSQVRPRGAPRVRRLLLRAAASSPTPRPATRRSSSSRSRTAYWYAMYKMGWIDLNKQRFQEALETFFQVAQATKNDKKQEVLNRASKKDFVRAYAEIGKADKAYDAFKRVDEKLRVRHARRSSPTSTWSRARATRRSTSTAS